MNNPKWWKDREPSVVDFLREMLRPEAISDALIVGMVVLDIIVVSLCIWFL